MFHVFHLFNYWSEWQTMIIAISILILEITINTTTIYTCTLTPLLYMLWASILSCLQHGPWSSKSQDILCMIPAKNHWKDQRLVFYKGRWQTSYLCSWRIKYIVTVTLCPRLKSKLFGVWSLVVKEWCLWFWITWVVYLLTRADLHGILCCWGCWSMPSVCAFIFTLYWWLLLNE